MTAPSPPTPASRPAPDREWDADGSLRAFAVRAVLLVGAGFFIGGVIGAGVALAGVATTWRRPVGPVAASAAALLVMAAFATVFEVAPASGSLRSNFADVRPVASACGLAAGVLAMVAVVTAAWRERAPQPATTDIDLVDEPGGIRSTLSATLAWASSIRGPLVVLAATFVVRGVLAPTPLQGAARVVATNLRSGAGYVIGTSGTYQATGGPSPVPVLLSAFAPGGGRMALLGASLALVGLAMALAHRLAGMAAAVIAGAAVLVLEVATTQHLPSTAAAALLVAAALFGFDNDRPSALSALAGVMFGLAVMSEPWAILAAPLLVLWMVLRGGRDRPGSPAGAAVALGVAIVTCAPWQRYLNRSFGTWASSTDMAFGIGTIAAFAPLAIVAIAALVASRRHPTEA